MTARTLAAHAACALLLASCASSGPPAPPPDPTYPERVLARIVAERDEPSFRVRHNPVVCGCPPYEIQLAGRWHRLAFVGVDPDNPTVLAVEAAARDARARSAYETWQLQGSLEDTLTTCGRGALVVGLEPRAFGAPPPEDAPEDPED